MVFPRHLKIIKKWEKNLASWHAAFPCVQGFLLMNQIMDGLLTELWFKKPNKKKRQFEIITFIPINKQKPTLLLSSTQ